MIQTTANFNENVNSASGMLWDIQLFDGNTQITDIITNVNITAYGDNNGLSIGSVCARSITFDIYEPTIELINKELLVKIGANGEYVPYGYYTVIITEKNRNITSYTLVDRIAARLDKKYVSALTFPTTDIAMLNEICAQANMPLKALEGQISHVITSYEQNYTLREIVGYLAQMQGKNAIANADGQLELRWYKPISKTIDNSKIYMDSQYVLNTNEGFTLGYLKCIAEDGTELAVGNGVTGITIKNPFMTQEIVNEVFLKIRDFSYFTSKIEFLGDLRLEPMDVVTVVKDGVSHSVPIIQLTHKYDGGVRTSISATSQSEVANSLNLKSSLQNQVDRIDGKVVGISQTITDVEGNVSNISQTVDTVSQTVSNLSGDVSNISQTVVGITQTVSDLEGNMTGINQTVNGITQTVTNISQDLTNNYSTTTQMQSAIEQSAQSIEASVVKNGEISSKLSLEEGTVSIVGDRFTVDSTNFKLSEDGTVECDAGNIGNFTIDNGKLISTIEEPTQYGSYTSTFGAGLYGYGTRMSGGVGFNTVTNTSEMSGAEYRTGDIILCPSGFISNDSERTPIMTLFKDNNGGLLWAERVKTDGSLSSAGDLHTGGIAYLNDVRTPIVNTRELYMNPYETTGISCIHFRVAPSTSSTTLEYKYRIELNAGREFGLFNETDTKWILKSDTNNNVEIPNGSLTISKTSYPQLILERTGDTYASLIQFNNANGVLGYIGMTGSANGGLVRYKADASGYHTMLDSENYINYVVPNTGGTFSNTITVGTVANGYGQLKKGAIELSTNTPLIDFHYNNNQEDYNVRLINDANDYLTMVGSFRPTGDGIKDLGASNRKWAKFYAQNIYRGGSSIASGSAHSLIVNQTLTATDTAYNTYSSRKFSDYDMYVITFGTTSTVHHESIVLHKTQWNSGKSITRNMLVGNGGTAVSGYNVSSVTITYSSDTQIKAKINSTGVTAKVLNIIGVKI